MGMDWKDAAATVAQYAPTVATALGGPAAGGITAGAARMVTDLLGVEDSPQGLVAATQDPEKLAELKRIDREHRAELTRLRLEAETAEAQQHTKRLAETNATMRAELATEGWYRTGWRPSLGYVFALSLGGLAAILAVTLLRDPTLAGDPEFTGLLVWVVGTMGAALGINVRERSKDKARQLGQEPQGFMSRLAARATGR